MVAPARKCPPDCGNPHHVPDELRIQSVRCDKYHDWLLEQAKSLRLRDKSSGQAAPPLADYVMALHRAVRRSKGLDEYTGKQVKWYRINHQRPAGPGRRKHRTRGTWPSVDHYNGTGKLDYRICSATVNFAKSALDEAAFVDLCRKVVRHHNKAQSERNERVASARRAAKAHAAQHAKSARNPKVPSASA
ncbi:hypothetical protein [Croceicoccus mobilis]|nr:hypothetical protein [Croceicoccus mobilis]